VQTVQSVSANLSPTKIYVTAEVTDRPVRCLLDSSCEHSVIGFDLVPNASLTPSRADVSVSKKVDEFLLGSDWLGKQGPSGTSPVGLSL